MTDLGPSNKRLRSDNDCSSDLKQSSNDVIRTSNADLLKEANEALQESNRIHVRPIVDETKLGIELFVGDKKDEFHGLIKSRYADFIVHEIDCAGKIAQLTDLEAPEEKESQKTLNLTDFIDNDAFECITEINNGYLNEYKIDVTGMDKETRTSVHHAIRAAFDRVESCTISDSDPPRKQKKDKIGQKDNEPDSTQPTNNGTSDLESLPTGESNDSDKNACQSDKRYILVTRRNKVSRPKNVWPRDRPDHTHFILYKENKDTMDAIHNLAASINTRPSNFSYAGTKDRRAVTSQWLSCWRLEPKRLISAARRFSKRPFIKVGNFCFKPDQLRLGQLKANKFDIVIRHLVYNSEGIKAIEEAMSSIKDKGFVNYFGLQRFGTRSIQTHEIGLAILQSKWAQAVDLILSYRFDDNMQPPQTPQDKDSENIFSGDGSLAQSTGQQKVSQGRRDNKNWTGGAEQHNSFIDLWKSKLDAETVFKKFPHYRFSNEGIIMKHLSKSEESSQDFFNALISMPRNTRSMYVHSYQSLLWNKLTTFRLRHHGFKVVPGDLILTPDSNVTDNSLDILLSADSVDPSDEGSAKVVDNDADSTQERKAPVEEIASKIKIATEDNLHKYSIFDVVLPIIGSRVRIPENNVGNELRRLLSADDLSLESFRAREKLFISYGSYRKIMVKPDNVNWVLRQYSNPHQNLVDTDLDLLNREISKNNDSNEKPASPPKSDSSDEALVVEFELPSSSYATMCLREIMKKPSTEINNNTRSVNSPSRNNAMVSFHDTTRTITINLFWWT